MDAVKKEWPLVVLGVGFLAWALVLLTAPIRPPASELTWVKFAELVIGAGAFIGTALAAGVALYFGLESQRKNDRQDRERMLLTAAGCLPRIKALNDFLGSFVAGMVFGGGPHATPEQVHQRLIDLFKHLSHLGYRCSDEELLRLVPLGNNVAGRLAKLQAELSMVASDLSRMPDWEKVDREYRAWMTHRFQTVVMEAARAVPLLAEELRLAAAEGVAFVEPQPDWDDEDDWK